MRVTWSTKHKWLPTKRHQHREWDERRNMRQKPFM